MQDPQRARVKLTKGSTQGWITIRDKHGVTFAEPNTKLYVCKTSVAMTDGQDIQDAKVIRKLAEGDVLNASTGEVKQDAAGIHRIQVKCAKSGEVGWITTQGNAGTVFAE